jgi:hypothetical protein
VKGWRERRRTKLIRRRKNWKERNKMMLRERESRQKTNRDNYHCSLRSKVLRRVKI